MSTGSNFNTSTIVNPDSIKIRWKRCKFSNRYILKLLFEILKFDFTMLMYCAIGRIGPAGKCIQGKSALLIRNRYYDRWLV